MQLRVNGESHVFHPSPSYVEDLLVHLQLDAERVAVEVNGAIVRRRDRLQHPLHDGDRVEIVTLVGGG